MSEQRALTIQEIHRGTIEVLKVVSRICDELHINYFLAYGTLIGAVRHKGFIPWDDDLDIMMLRPDYDKFLDYCAKNEEKLHPYRLLHYTNTSGYPYAIPRFCDTRYQVRNEDPVLDVEGMGFFIDVYPLDGVLGNSDELRKSIVRRKKLLLNGFIYATTRSKAENRKNPVAAAMRSVFRTAAIALKPRFFTNQIEKFATQYTVEESDYITLLTWESSCHFYDKKHFAQAIEVDFEDIKAKIPVGYDTVLRSVYGDYMQLPPEEKRVGHHCYSLYKRNDC